MKNNIKVILGMTLLLLIFNQSAGAQILQSRSDIIKSYGTPFSSGVTESGDNYLFYKIPVTTKTSGTYEQRRIMFFKENDNGTEICYKFKIIEPSSETAYNIFSFTRNLVQIDNMRWKDYGKGIVYQVKEDNGVCKITAWYDNQVELAKVYKF